MNLMQHVLAEVQKVKYMDIFLFYSNLSGVKVLCYNSEGRWFDPCWCR